MRDTWQPAVFLLLAGSLAACSTYTPITPAAVPTSTIVPAWILPSDSWIEIDLAGQILSLHQAQGIAAEYPVSTGVTTAPQYTTPPDLYRVQSMDPGPVESVPGVFVSHVIMFDLGRGNAIHSLPMDATGNVLDNTLGAPASAGCVRVAEADRVFDFAKVGMWVWIH